MKSVIKDATAHARFLWREGELVRWSEAKVHVSSVGHASVAAVFEGIKAYWNEQQQELFCFRLRDHVSRLLFSARLARLSCCWTEEQVLSGILDLLRANDIREDTYIRPWLFAKGLIRDLMVPANVGTELVIDCWPFVAALPESSCRACVSSWTHISDRFMPPRIKAFSNYSNGRLGMIEAQMAGYDYPIFLNENGMVTESAGACVATIRNGTVYTPPLAAGILDSITRATLITSLVEKGIPVRETNLSRTDLYAADEAFFLGTGWEVLPISEVDGMPYQIQAPGPLTSQIRLDYSLLVRGQVPDRHAWLTPVWRISDAQSTAVNGTSYNQNRSTSV